MARDAVLDGMLANLEATVERMRRMDADWEASDRAPEGPDESGSQRDPGAEPVARDEQLEGMLGNLEATVERMRRMDAEWAAAEAARDQARRTDSAPRDEPGEDGPEAAGGVRPSGPPSDPPSTPGWAADEPSTPDQARRPDGSWRPDPDGPIGERPDFLGAPDDSLGRNGDVLFEGSLPEGGTPLYRGIPRLLPDGSVNPAYAEAVSGRAVPRGTVSLSAEEHIGQRRAAESDTTSWSRTRSSAEAFTNGDGVILEWRTGLPPEGASWKFKPIFDLPDQFAQVLIQGTLSDAQATRYLSEDANPEPVAQQNADQQTGATATPHRTPDADAAAHARDVELLGAPAGDEWSRLSAAEVGERLREHLRQVTGNPEFEVFGFDADGVHPEVVREFARAMVDMADRFPNADVRSVGLGELPPKVIGAAQPRVDPVTGRVFTESIVLSSDYARSAEGFRERMREGVERYGHSPTTLRRAVYAAVVHEYGHALDHAGQQTTRHQVEDAYLAGRYGEDWLGQLSGHSFDREGMLRPAEALAESFAEVELRKALAADALRGLRPLGAAELELYELLARSTENPPEPGYRPDASEPDYSGPDTTPLPGDSDAALLGAPADDEWSRLSPAEVGQKLRDDLRRMTDNPEFEVTGFDRDGLNAEVLREYARSMVDMFQKYPQADLRRIVIDDLPHDVFASTTRRADTSNLRVYADELLINAHYAASATEFRNAVDADSASGWLHPGVARRPVYAVAVHEFGHVLDFSSSSYAQRKLDAALLKHYMSDRLGEPTTEGYLDWLKDNLSGYSLEESGLLNPREALAEAFADVELRGRDAVSEPVRVAYDLLREALDRSARRGRIGHFLDGFRLAIDTVRNAPDAGERHAIRSEPDQPRNEIGARTDDPVAPGDRHGPGPVARDAAAERPDSAEQQAIRLDAEQPGDADDPRREADSPLDEPDRRVEEPGARDLVRPDEGQPVGWQYRPIDVAAAEVREVLVRSEIGRQALTRLRDLGAAIRFEEPGDGPGLPDGFDGRTMEVFIGTRGRDQLAQAAAVVRAAELARAVVEGRLEVTPARIRELDRADHVAARVRVEAEALGRQAEFHREMREAGYDPHGGPVRDLIDAAQRRALESVYLDAFDATGGVDRTDGPPVDEPSRQAIRDAEVARLTARRDTVAAEVDAARARRAEAMRGLASEADVRTRAALTDTLEQLHGRTTRVDQLRAWQDRLAELERAALRLIDLEEVLAGADAQLRHVLDAGAVARRPDLEQRRAAGVDELLADPRFDARADVGDGSSGRHEAGVDELPADLRLDARDGLSARHEAGEEWDAAHRPSTPEEYAPSDLATAREMERLQRAESAARRELTRIEADWDRAFRRLKNAYNLPDDEIPSTRQEILDLFRERSERIDIWNGTSYVLLLAELTAQHARVSADRARLLGEITDVVARDLSDRAARAGDPPPTGIRVHLDESGVPQVLRDSADVPAADARTDPPRRPAEETYPLTITEHAGTMLDRALRALHGSDLGKWAADLLDRLGVDIRFTTESEASIVRLDGGRYGLRPAAGYDPVTDTVVLESDGGADRHAAELIRAARLAEQVSEAAGEPLARLAMSRDEYVDLMLDRMAEAYALMYAGNADFTGKIDLNRIGVDDLERAYAKAYDDALKYAEKTYWKSGVVRSFPLYHRAAFRAGVRAVREHLNNLGPMVDWRSYGDHFGAAWDRAHGITPTEPVGTDAPAIREDTPARIAERSRHVALEIESLRMLRDLGEYVPVSPAERAYTEAYDKAYTKADKAHRRNPAAPPPEEVAYQAGREAVRRYLDRVGLAQAEIALDVVRAAGNHGESRWGHPKAPEDGIAQGSDRTPNHEIERAAEPDLARRVLDQEFDSHPHPERLTDRVARYPDYSEPGSRPRLVVVAEPGQHVDALRELALSHPELADVLWDRSHYLDYRNAVVGAGGLPTMHHITVTAAEGPYRHPSPDEAETQMLAHYLRYRADGLTHLGFDEWIRQLGPAAFYTAEDAKRARGTRRQGWHVEGRLVDRFLEAGYRTAAEADPPLGPPHPAEIAHRLYTRQIPLPGDTGIRRPAHHQLEVFKVGTTHFGIYLEADGNGGWRVPAPVSTGSDADVLATHLQGLAAPDRKKLVARIVEMLNDGSADLTDRSQPRNRFGRFIDRLTPGRSGTPEDDSGDRSTDEGDHPRVDRDRMADESGRAARPPEDIAPDVTDAEVLGVPGADEWSHLSPHEVGERLQDRLRAAMGNPEFEVFGFDLPGLDPEVVREYARAMVDMYERFPHVDLRSVGIGDLRRGELGYADGAIDEVSKAVYTRAIVLSYDHATSARDFRAAVYNAIGNDQFKPMMLRRPVYATVVHEYGHALDHHGNLAARRRAQSHLLDLAAADPDADFGQWLRELSGYSLDDDGLLDDHEAVAEAFAEVVLRDMLDDLGPAGKPVRALHDLLLEHARDPVELGRDAEAPANDRLVLDDPVDQVRDLLGQTEFGKQILASLDHGPTRTRFEDFAQDGRTGEFRRRELAALAFTAGNSQVRQALTLAHESLHAQRYLQRTTANTPEHIRTMSREEFVDAMIDEEAAATGRHFRLARELRALGYEIAEHPLEQRYNEVFDQVIENLGQDKPWTRTEAHEHGVAVLRDSIGQVEWNNGQTYAGYYGNAWDEADTARDGAAEPGRHRPLSSVTADGLWQSALHRQDARLRAREAAEEFARRAEAVLGEGSGDLTRSDIERALREAEADLDTTTRVDHGAKLLRRQHDLRVLADLADLRDQAQARLEGRRHSLAALAARDVLGAVVRGESGARVLTDHVAYVPGEPDRLVIAAEPGDYQRVMREAERDPFAAALLGRDGVDRRYLAVETDDFGRVQVRSVDAPDSAAPHEPVADVTPRDLSGTAAAERTARIRAEMARTELGREVDQALTAHQVTIEYRSGAPDRYYPAQRRLVLDPGLSDTDQMRALLRAGVHADLAHEPDMPNAARLRTQSSRRRYIAVMLDLETAAHLMEFAAIRQLRAALHDIPETQLERAYTDAFDAAREAAAAAEPDATPERLDDLAREAAFDVVRPLMDTQLVSPDQTYAEFYGDAWDDANGHRSFDRVVQDAIASGEAEVTVLREGDSHHSARWVERVRFADGTELIRKTVVNPRHAVAEVLTSVLGRAIEAPVPESVLDPHDPTVVYQQVMPGEPAADRHGGILDPHELGYADSVPGRALGLLDTLVRIPDRDGLGWLAGPDRGIAGIDHSRSYENSDEARAAISPFAEGFLVRDGDGTVRYRDNPMTREAVDILLDRVAALRPRFERYGRGGWHDLVMERLAQVREHARDVGPVRRSEPPQFYTPIGGDDDIVRVVPRTEQTYDWRDNDDHGIYATLDPFEGVLRVRMRVSDGPTEAATMFGNAMSELGGHWVNEIQGEWQREGASDALDADQRDLYRTAEEAVARTLLGRLAAEHGFTEVRIEPADSGDNTVPIVRFTKPEFAPADTVSTPDDADAPDRTADGSPQPAADDAADADRTADQREQTDTDERKTEDLWQLEPVDIATDQVWQILEQNAIGREAAQVLRAEGARVRFADLGNEIGEADAFDRRTMDISVDTHDRGQVELAGELVRLAALTEAIRDGQVEVTPARIRGTTREDYVAAQLRADAAAIGRQAEFLRQLEQAGYPGRPTAMAPVDVHYRRAMHQQYLDAYDAAVSRLEQADPTVDAERLRERGRAAGVDALLAGELFDGSWSEGESASARNAHGRDWDAAQRMDIPSDVYRPATAEAARDTQALLRRHAALNREIGRFDAMRDRLIPHLEGFDPENNVFDRQALRPDRSLLAHLQDLAQARLEVGDDQLSLFQTQVRVLTDLAAERTRVVEARDRLALELAARVGHDLMDRQVDEAGGSWLTDRVAWVPGSQPKLFVAETGDRYTRVTGDEAPFTSVRETLWYQDVVADRVWVDIDDSGDVRLRRQETDPRDVWSEEDGRWMREHPEGRRVAPRSPDRSATEEPTPTGRTAEQKTPAEHAAEQLDRALLELDGDNRRVYMNMRGERVRGEGNYPGRWAMSTVDRHGIEVRFTLEDQLAARDGRQVLRSGTGYVPSADAIVLHLNSSALELAETIVHAATMADRTRAAGDGTLERVTLSRDEYISTMLDRQAEAHARAFEFTRVRDRRNSYRGEDERTPDEPRTVEHNDRLRQSYDEARKKARKVAARAYKGNSSVRDTMLDAAAFRAAVREVRAALVERGPLIDGVDYATYYAAEWDRANGFTAADLDHAPDPHKQDSPELRRMRTADFAVEIETLRMLRDSGRFVPVGPAETAYTQAYDRAYRKARRADDGTPPERRAMDAGLAALRKYVDKVGLPEAEIAMEVARSGADNQGEYQPWPLDDDPSTRTRVATEEVGDLGAARRAIAALLDRYPEGVRLTERIALLPDERWDGQRLVIAAQRGGHIDALLELSVRNAEYSDVLWAGTQNRQYLLVTPGEEDGRTRWLNSGEAEGAYRAPSRHETMEQFLAHYLRYRLARRTGLGFESWLRQLGPEMFHTKKDQREADAHEAYEGRANKGTLRPDALRNFRTEPEADEPHPAVVAHRLATRQVPLPTSWGRGVSWPRSTLGRIEIADYTFGIVLEADGNGGWRVPAPNGDGGLDDALSQLFQGMSDKSPKRLANRIASMLDDGGADLIRREPRGRLRRMAGRLSLGSRDGQDDAPRAIDAGESEHNPPQFGPPRPPDPDEGRRAEADQRRAVLERLAAENRAAVRERDAARAADDPERLAGAEERVERLDRAMAAALERDVLLRAGARPITDRVGILAGEPPMVLVVNLGGTDPALALTEAAARYPEVAQALDRAARPRELRVDADGTIRVVPFAPRADGPEHPAGAPPQREGVAEPGDPVDVSRQPEDVAEPGGADTAQPASGDGGAEKPPTTPPSADGPGDEPSPRSDWYFQMRIEQADWEADMAADHAAWLRELADARPNDRWARLRAEQAEWNARMAADRAAWLRLEQAQHEAWTAAAEADRLRRAADADRDDPWAELRAQQAEWDARMAEDRAGTLHPPGRNGCAGCTRRSGPRHSTIRARAYRTRRPRRGPTPLHRLIRPPRRNPAHHRAARTSR
ncbi:hypothetical protein, partial [Nocardia abscessus]|uniref:hypothetical protein n=1 Tax=Nocardia abscessus TaxID=120957 RepID=UPI0005B924E0